MKKIVALVLSLVMVLGLATVAFADTTSTTIKAEGYSVMAIDNSTDTAVVDNFTKTVTDKVVTTAGDLTTTTYFADVYEIDGATYYACDSSIATSKLVKGGKVVAYLTEDTGLAAGATKTATAFVKAPLVPACGDYTEDVYTVNGKNYAVGTDEYVLYKGKFVGIAADPSTAVVPHVFDDETVTTDNKGKVVAIECDECEKNFKVVDAVPVDYTGVVEAYGQQFILMGAYVAADDAADEKVESAETFDAGIAMYVGMSVMAAAGSAVVLKKKD